jgi:hypothetical protein
VEHCIEPKEQDRTGDRTEMGGERAEKKKKRNRVQTGRLVRMISVAQASRRADGGSLRIKSAITTITADRMEQGRAEQ